MRIVHLTDLHSDSGVLKKITDKSFADLIIISGDITHFGHSADAKKILGLFLEKKWKILAVTGNCDYPDCENWLISENISIDSDIREVDGIQFAGLGGSLYCPGTTPNEFSEEDFSVKLEIISQKIASEKPLILVSHQPPFDTLNDKVPSGMHVGCHSIREFIETFNPVLCLTGHIHEGQGVDFIGKCPIVNPGPAKNGNYALIEITGQNPPTIKLC